MATRLEQIVSVLERLSANAGSDVTGAVAVSTDGIVLASRISGDVNADRLGATAATLVGMSKRVSNDLKISMAEESIVRADNGLLMVLPAGEQGLLAVTMRQGATLGIVMIEVARCRRRDRAGALAWLLGYQVWRGRTTKDEQAGITAVPSFVLRPLFQIQVQNFWRG